MLINHRNDRSTLRSEGGVGFALRFVVTAAWWLGSASAVGGQASPTSDPLYLPRAKLACRILGSADKPSLRPGLVAIRFLEGDGLIEDRTIDATYDSAGHPVYLTVLLAPHAHGEEIETEGFAIGFGIGETARGFVMTHRSAIPSAGSPGSEKSSAAASRLQPLSSSQFASARTLAVWLWGHRCGKG